MDCGFLSDALPEINIVIVGDRYVGKTFLLKTYLTREYPKEKEAPRLERYYEDITVDGQDFHLVLWEPVVDNCDKTRIFIYGKGDCILICYAVNDHESFQRASTFWYSEIHEHCPDTPVVLIANKIDLRDSIRTCISFKEGKKLQSNLNAADLLECSSLLGIGLREIFIKSVRVLSKEKCKVS